MTRYRLTPAAQRDLLSIGDSIEARWNLRQAETYVSEIRVAIERIADNPSRGRDCDEIRAGYRRYGVGSHLLVYVETAAGVDVIRILHQRMHPTLHPGVVALLHS